MFIYLLQGVIERTYNTSTSLPTISTYTSSVGYLVWHDSTGQGIYTGQAGINNVIVNLLLYGSGICSFYFLSLICTVIATTMTNNTGYYIFTNVKRGSGYQTQVVLPAGYIYTQIGQGSNITLNSKANPFDYGISSSFYVAAPPVTYENSGLLFPWYLFRCIM